jgi:hypothetical protein
MRSLNSAEIEKFASKKGVKRIAVENFLATMGEAGSERGELANLSADAASYKWNSATKSAIASGIRLAYKR